MQKPILSDPDVFPTPEILAKFLGKTMSVYNKIIEYTHTQISGVEDIWTYYRDGNNWLLRLMRKSKTYFWISVFEGYFKVTFYLNSSAEKKIPGCDIPEQLKKEYEETKNRQIRWIAFPVKTKDDFEIFKNLLQIKANLK